MEPLRNSKGRKGFSSVARGLWESLVPRKETVKAEESSWLCMLTLLKPELDDALQRLRKTNRLSAKAADRRKEQNKICTRVTKMQSNDLIRNMIDTLSQSNQNRINNVYEKEAC